VAVDRNGARVIWWRWWASWDWS